MEIGFDVLIKYVFFIESKFMRYQNKLVLMFMFNKHSKLPLSFIESVCCCMNAQRVDVCVCFNNGASIQDIRRYGHLKRVCTLWYGCLVGVTIWSQNVFIKH